MNRKFLKIISVMGYVILVISAIAVYINKSLLGMEVISISVRIIAVLLIFWARITFGIKSFHLAANPTEGGLVTSGPYSFIRHPIYASFLYFLWAGVLTHDSPINFLFGILACIGVIIRIYTEEKLIVESYPDYKEYSSKTKRIIPYIL